MKKIQLAIILLALILVFPASTKAGVDVNINISLPPLFMLEAPPVVIALPDTNNVYVVPDMDMDIFFWNGWWWMPWEGHWYRSAHYNRGWAYYNNIPSFYFDVDPGWRGYYRDHNWHGHRWDYERIPNQRLQQNWKSWQNNRRWERQGTWGVQNYQPRPQQQRQELRQQRQQQYQQRPEVQKQRQQPRQQPPIQQPKPKPQVQQPRQQPQERVQQQQRQEQRTQGQQPKQQPREKVQQPRQQPQERAQQPQQSKPRQGRPERGEQEKPDRR